VTGWPSIGEEIAVWAAIHGRKVDAEWLGRTLRAEDYGMYVPMGHPNTFKVWAAVE
jgi:hypothetical protein